MSDPYKRTALTYQFYQFLGTLPNTKIYFDTNILHPGKEVLRPDFKRVDLQCILENMEKANELAKELASLGNYRITSKVNKEITCFTRSIRNIISRAAKLARITTNPAEQERYSEIELAYTHALELAEEQEETLANIVLDEEIHPTIKRLAMHAVARYGLNRKTITKGSQSILEHASSQTDIDLVLTLFCNETTKPRGVLSLDIDIARLFSLCSMIFYHPQSPFNGIVRADPKDITAHFSFMGQEHSLNARNITDTITSIPRRKEKEFFEYLENRKRKLYGTTTRSGRFKIVTLEDVALTE